MINWLGEFDIIAAMKFGYQLYKSKRYVNNKRKIADF